MKWGVEYQLPLFKDISISSRANSFPCVRNCAHALLNGETPVNPPDITYLGQGWEEKPKEDLTQEELLRALEYRVVRLSQRRSESTMVREGTGGSSDISDLSRYLINIERREIRNLLREADNPSRYGSVADDEYLDRIARYAQVTLAPTLQFQF